MPLYPNTIIVCLHNGNSTFFKFQGSSIINSFNHKLEGGCFPGGFGYEVDYHYATDSIGKLFERYPETPIAIEIDSKYWHPDTRTVDLTFTMRNDGPDLHGEYWYHVIVTEDNIKEGHMTWPGCSHSDSPSPFQIQYFNHWVTRKIVMDTLGDPLVGPSWFGQLALTRSCSFTIKPEWVAYNCNVVINVYKKADSLYKSPVLQAIKESITNASAIGEEKTVDQGITGIFPNPVSDMANLHFTLSSGSVCSLNIFDLKGQKIKNLIQGYVNPGTYNVEILTQEIPSGTYLVVLETEMGKSTSKIVIL